MAFGLRPRRWCTRLLLCKLGIKSRTWPPGSDQRVVSFPLFCDLHVALEVDLNQGP